MITRFLELLRIKHWLKNVFVLAPLFFSGQLSDPAARLHAALAFFAFSFAAGATYIFNDLVDLRADRNHPVKRMRALAAGRVRPLAAWIFLALPLALAILACLLVAPSRGLGLLAAVIAYLALNVFYSLAGKNIIILDAFCIALGFVLRIIGGCEAIGVRPSSWILVTTFFLSLFLGFGKRRNEILLLGEDGPGHRKVLDSYKVPFLDQLIAVTGAIAILSYSLYTLDADVVEQFGTDKLIYTIPFVVFGIFRYMFHIKKDEEGDPTEVVTRDKGLAGAIILWILAVIAVIYGGR